ncbi:MAG TPA: UDP-3-O-(3-hydroxymyristoyl)glucosamine N-acyltransferase [Thermoanaerobaculia bacterium]|nr:UDP-3-O-(3-hydroxymyristoyl)glucosamine N-acyltransferase [Thermoanaerobaculia bacterium]
MAYRLAELAELVGGRVEGDPERTVEALRSLETAGPRDLSFVSQPRLRARGEASGAGALLVGGGARRPAGRDLLVVDDPAYAWARLLALFHPAEPRLPGVHPTAVVEPGAAVDAAAHVGPYAVIGARSRVEAGAAVLALAVVGCDCVIGEGSVLHPHAVLYDRTVLGRGCEVHSGAVLGGDGFGYATHDGMHQKIPQVGRVLLEDEVEIGVNTAIDRASLDETRIGAGTKIDNLVQVGHNTTIGRHCILCGQVGLAGSTRLGDGVVLGGQAATLGHLEVGDGVQGAARVAIMESIPARARIAGHPAIELPRYLRQTVLISRLEEMSRRIKELEKRLGGRGGEEG